MLVRYKRKFNSSYRYVRDPKSLNKPRKRKEKEKGERSELDFQATSEARSQPIYRQGIGPVQLQSATAKPSRG
jgi:hypothetical protein